jgi:hypothetical protein
LETPNKRKESAISRIIDTVLKQVFGNEATLFMYNYLEQHYSLRKDEFSEKIDVFAKGLEDCLSSGAFVVESKILDRIYTKYGMLPEMDFERIPEEYDFASQIKLAMQIA